MQATSRAPKVMLAHKLGTSPRKLSKLTPAPPANVLAETARRAVNVLRHAVLRIIARMAPSRPLLSADSLCHEIVPFPPTAIRPLLPLRLLCRRRSDDYSLPRVWALDYLPDAS